LESSFDPEATRLVAPTSRRTPAPERIRQPRPPTQPPPLPGMPPGMPPARSAPREDTPIPGTVHNRNPNQPQPAPLPLQPSSALAAQHPTLVPLPQAAGMRPMPLQPPPMQQPPTQQAYPQPAYPQQ